LSYLWKSARMTKKTPNGRPLGRPRTKCAECARFRRRRAASLSPNGNVEPVYGPNRAAAEATIEALRLAGHLEPVDASRIATLRAIATALDLDPGSAPLWREFRMSETALRLSGASGAEVDQYTAVMRALGGES
jgi:hypothetical protein